MIFYYKPMKPQAGMTEKYCQARILYLKKVAFKNEGEIKIFPVQS